MSEQSLTPTIETSALNQEGQDSVVTGEVSSNQANSDQPAQVKTPRPSTVPKEMLYPSDTQFQGLIELVNAKTDDLQKSIDQSPTDLSEGQDTLDDNAKLALEKTYRDINHLINQQRALQSQQTSMHQSLLERESKLDKRERTLLERSLEVERELRASERARHSYEQKLQIVAEKEANVDEQRNRIDELVEKRVNQLKNNYQQSLLDVESKYAEEFQVRCQEAESDFEARYAELEDRYQQKKSILLDKMRERQEQVESEIADKVETIEQALITKLNRHKSQAAEILDYEKGSLKEKEAALQDLYNERLTELSTREADIEKRALQSNRELARVEEIQSSFARERETIDEARSQLIERSLKLKSSSEEFKVLLESARKDKALQESLKEELLTERADIRVQREELEGRLTTLKADQASMEVHQTQLTSQESELNRKTDLVDEELREAKSSRERSLKLESEVEERLLTLKQKQAELKEREDDFLKLKISVEERDIELNRLTDESRKENQEAKNSRSQASVLREDAQRLHEMRSNALMETEAIREQAERNAEEVKVELENLKSRQSILQSKLVDIAKEREDLAQGRAALSKEQEEVDKEYKEALNAVKQQSISVEEIRERLEDREGRIKKRESTLDQREQELLSRIEDFDTREGLLEDKEKAIKNRNLQSLEREQEAAQLHQNLAVRESKLKVRKDYAEELMTQVQQERSALEMDIAALEIEKAGLSGLSERAKELDERVRQIESRRADIEDKARELQRTNDLLKNEKSTIEAQKVENQRLLHEAKAIEQSVNAREQDLNQQKQEFEADKEQLRSERASIQHKRRDLEVDQALFDTKSNELESLKRQIENDQFEMDALQREIEESHVLNLKLIEERARLEEGLSRVEDREEELNQREELISQKEESMWQLENDVTESLEEAKERDRWSRERLVEVETREAEMRQETERYKNELKEVKERYNMAVRSEERMQLQVGSVEATSDMLQGELESARIRVDKAEEENRQLLKRNTQLEIDIKSKSLIAQRAEEALIKAKDELSFNQDIREKLNEANRVQEEAEALRDDVQKESSALQEQKLALEEREKVIKAKDEEVDRLRKRLESQENELKRSVEEALHLAQEERELAEVARKAAEADRVAAKADRQVAQRELIASTRKVTGSYTLDSIREGLLNSNRPDEQVTQPPTQANPPQAKMEMVDNVESDRVVESSKVTPKIESIQENSSPAQEEPPVATPKPTKGSAPKVPTLNLPKRGPRDPRGGAKQMARFGALEIPLRRCPEGLGRIGSESHEGRAEEKPIHQVKFAEAFWLSETPVTQLQWMAVMRSNPSQFTDPYRPVDGVSWLDAARFCNRMSAAYQFAPAYEIVENNEAPMVYWREEANGFRLPTEAEWEYAARANSAEVNRLYSGDDLDQISWYRDNSGGETRPVGLKASNDWGFADLCGNVWEWCHDEWTRSAYQERSNQADGDTQSSVTQIIWNPVVYRPDLRHKVARGGSFADSPNNCRIACRGRLEVFGRRYSVGLRLCLPYELTL